MKFQTFLSFAASLIVASLATTGAVSAQPGGEGAAQNQASRDPMYIYKQVGINSEQEGEIRKQVKDFESAQRVRVKLLINLVKDMRGLQLQPDPSEEEVLAKQTEINNVSSQSALERVKLMLKIRAILTPGQKQKLVDLVKSSSEQGAGNAGAGGGGQ